ncbi:MAG: N-acetylglucosamine-specific PTS transporter subunit IIBC [Eubacteriales bacterium]
MTKLFAQLQRIGKALMLPIAVLPAAALLLRLGAEDVFNIPFITNSGGVIFDNLALLFAIGIAIGISYDGAGAAALSGAVGYFVLNKGAQTINPDINMGVLAGIIAGYLAGVLYNRYHDKKVPEFLGFFGGKRFVPIITGLFSIILALIFGFVWPPIQSVIYSFGEWLISAGAVGVGIYGTFNALLLPFGLHHVLNTLVWFIFGNFTNPEGVVVTGDLFRFFAGDLSAGPFMAGFYPVFMFGMPAVALAIYHTAKKEQKAIVGGILFSAGLTFFLTGIGEPLLFSFCFVAPFLYLIHALLQGSALAITYLLGIKHGFGFSAGLIDYVLNWGLATKPWMIIPLGIIYFVIYYFIFKFFILKFDLPTPGREKTDFTDEDKVEIMNLDENTMALKFIEYLGGVDNFEGTEACITRLRLQVEDVSLIDEKGLKSIGAAGVLKIKNNIQIVVGTKADFIANSINNALKKSKSK